MINVTKTFLPDFEEYAAVLKRAWDKGWITNNGELVRELEQKLKFFLNVDNLLFCNNGTIVLQMALRALDITKEVITTPFSYVTTTNAILWEGCQPVFVDIDPHTFCIDPNKIESAITKNTQAILATHVYGYPCDVEKIKNIADKHGIKVIYDGAHAFGSEYKGRSLLSYGDISTCSFHATKIFHTAEGGCLISNSKSLIEKAFLYRQAGHIFDDYLSLGLNGKNSELHAALGLCILPKVPLLIEQRARMIDQYDKDLSVSIERPKLIKDFKYNNAYYPILFDSEESLLKVIKRLEKLDIYGRRYFSPSLNTLPYIKYQQCKISEDISKRIFCLPLFNDLTKDDIQTIIDCIL